MCRSPVLKPLLLLTALLLAGPAQAGGSWGWSVHYGSPSWSYGHYRYGDPYWNSRWRYPWYRRSWQRSYWDDYRRYTYPRRPRPAPAPKVVTAASERTLSQEAVPGGSRASLPANARLLMTPDGPRYQWQEKCYRFDYLGDRYLPVSCPSP
ncbi:hypothetical protein [Ferrimonas balearica]|uniref:hypothetical protein n=1 Tax=Ferrimonas balearica TaxID=44012 RepID=UPI001C9A1DFA|nr:hypothetical protein [Ferrimonas balearica]MBY5993223.1 hypothetical protein [Ferrimonas balearica]